MRALLVRPIDHGKVCLRGKLAYAHGLVNRPRRAQRRDHAIGTVVHAAVLLAVQMRSAQDVRCSIVPGEQAENVPCGIDAHLGARRVQLPDEPCAMSAIVRGERHAVGSTVGLAADGHRLGEQGCKTLRRGYLLIHERLLCKNRREEKRARRGDAAGKNGAGGRNRRRKKVFDGSRGEKADTFVF